MKPMSKYSTLVAGTNLIVGLVAPFFVIFLMDSFGLAMSFIGVLFAVRAISSMLFSIPFNWIGDKFIRKPLMVLAHLGLSFIYYRFTVMANVNELLALMILIGIFAGMCSVESAFLAELTKGPKRGAKMGFYRLFVGLLGAVAMLIGARAIELFGFNYLFYACAAVNIFFGFALLFISPEDVAEE